MQKNTPTIVRPMAVVLVCVSTLSCARATPQPGPAPDPGGTGVVVIPPLQAPRAAVDPAAPDPLLHFTVREVPPEERSPAAGPQLQTTPLPGAATAALLARLPALPAARPSAFQQAAASPPAPRPGHIVTMDFPSADTTVPERPSALRQPLQVVRVAPEGEADVVPAVTVSFSRPMVPLTTVAGTEAREVPARLMPLPPGRWLWLDPHTLRFEPEGRLPRATTYRLEVPAGTRSVDGETLAEAVSVTFGTPALRAIGGYPALLEDADVPARARPVHWHGPDATAVRLDPVLLLVFDQAVAPAALLRSLTLLVNGRPHAVRLATVAELEADAVASALARDAPEGRWIALRPGARLPRAADVRLRVEAGAPSAEGPRRTSLTQEMRFRTYGRFEVVAHECGYGRDDCPPGAWWFVRLSNAIDPEAWSDTLVRIDPAVEELTVSRDGAFIRLRGLTRPATTYRVTLSPALRDVFGQPLEGERTVTFRTGAMPPAVAIAGGPHVVLDPGGPQRVLVRSQGVLSFRVRVSRVRPEQWPEFGGAVEAWLWGGQRPERLPGTAAMDTVIAVRDALWGETAIDLGPALGGAPGHAVMVVEVPGSPSAGRDGQTAVAWVQSTRIGLHAAVDASGVLAWATSLDSGAPLAGVDVALLPGPGGSRTAADGTVRLPIRAEGGRALVARLGDDTALLPDNPHGRGDGWRLPPATHYRWFVFDDRGLYRPGDTAHVKGWLRLVPPGAGFSLAQPDVSGVRYTVRGPRGEEVASGIARPGRTGGFHAAIALPSTLNLGHVGVQLAAEGGEAGTVGYSRESWHGLRVQEFRRPDYEVTAEADPGPHTVGDSMVVSLRAAYFGGGGLGGAPVEWRFRTETATWSPAGWSEWRFGRDHGFWYSSPGGEQRTLSTRTSADGSSGALLTFDRAVPPFPVRLTAEAEVLDVTRQAGSVATHLLVHPASFSVGLRTSRNWLQPGEPLTVDVVAVDHDGRTVAGRTVTLTLHELSWNQRTSDGAAQEAEGRVVCDVVSADIPVSCTFSADRGGPYRLRAVARDEAGRPTHTELTVWVAGTAQRPPVRDGPGQVDIVADRSSYESGDTARLLVTPPFGPAEALVTVRAVGVMTSERVRITGETHEVRVPITAAHLAGATVRVELVDAATGIRSASGEVRLAVGTRRRRLEVVVTPQDSVLAPGASTAVDVVVRDASGRPAAGAEVTLWMVDEAILAAAGYQLRDPLETFHAPVHPAVRDESLRNWVVPFPRSAGPGTVSGVVILGQTGGPRAGLEVAVEGTGEAVRTGFDGSFTLRGVPAGEHVLIIEAGELGRSRMRIRVPAAGVNLGNVVVGEDGAVRTADGRLELQQEVAVTGQVANAPLPPPAPPPPPGAPKQASDIEVREVFAPLAFFEASLTTDAHGRVRVQTRIPQSLTRYRVMAVAAAGAAEFGTGEALLTARRDLMVRITAPRFLNFGDSFELPVLVQNLSARTLDVDVAARAAGLRLATDASAGQRVRLAPGERAELRFDATTQHAGTAVVQVAAASGVLTDAAQIELPIYTPASAEAFALYGELDAGEGPLALPVARPRNVHDAFGGVELTVTSTALHALTDAVLYLHEYRLETAEAIASRVLAIATLRDALSAFAAEGLPPAAALEATVSRDIATLAGLQNDDGGWGFWPAMPSQPFVSVHVAHALARAGARGFTVPQTVRARALAFLRNVDGQLRDWPPAARLSATAYALSVRHLLGDVDAAPLARRHAVRDDLSVEATAWLLGVLADDAGSSAERATLLRNLLNRVEQTAGGATVIERYGEGSHLVLHSRRRSDAIALDALVAADPRNPLIPRLVQTIMGQRTAGRWSGTQENVWVLVALDRYFRTYEATTPAFTARVWLGERYAGGSDFRGRSTERQHLSVPLAQVPLDTTLLTLARDGAGRLYYRAALRYAPDSERLAPLARGFIVSRTYEAVDDAADVMRASDGTWRIRAGSRVRVRVAIVAASMRQHVALIDPLPAGFEPLNPEVQGTGIDPQNRTELWRPSWYEHRNLRDDRAEAFTTVLGAGSYEFVYTARATTPGRFNAPPARAEMMYEPETFGRSASDVVVVR